MATAATALTPTGAPVDLDAAIIGGGGRPDWQADVAAWLDSRAPNTARAYRRAWAGWADFAAADGAAAMPANVATLAAYVDALAARASIATIRQTVAAVGAVHVAAGLDSPASAPRVKARVKAAAEAAPVQARARGQAPALDVDAIGAILTTARNAARAAGSAAARRRHRQDAALAALLFQAGLRRSEVAALEWRDVTPTATGATVRVRTSKANRDGARVDVRFIKGACAAAVADLRPADADGAARVFGGLNADTIGRRFKAAAQAASYAATSHSGRVTLASELTRRGASTHGVADAGGWQDARMVQRYSAGARAERGAVARYL